MECIIDGHHGVYVPQAFAERYRNAEGWRFGNTRAEDWASLLFGPDDEWYWDAWDTVLSNAESDDGQVLHLGESGDLFLAWPDELED